MTKRFIIAPLPFSLRSSGFVTHILQALLGRSEAELREYAIPIWRLRTIMFAFIAATIAIVMSAQAASHPVSVSRAYVYVTRAQITAKVEVFVEDLYLFHKLKPNDEDFLEPSDIDHGIKEHTKFLLERFSIRDVAGQKLEGRLVEVDKSKVPAEGVPLANLMAHTLTFEFQYELPTEPEFLTFSQHFMDDKILVPSEVKLNAIQESAGSPEMVALKPGEPITFRYSWTNPPLGTDASDEEWDKWFEKQKEETLGITSYSSVYSFLYIEDHEVRHEILIPLLTLEDSVLLARDDDDFLDISEQDAARQQIEAFFKSGNPIEIDGVAVTPTVDRCDFYGLDLKDFAKQAERRSVSIANARVGIILNYPTPQTPENVKVTWDRFNNYVFSVEMVVYAFDDAARTTLSRIGKRNTYEWENPGREPPPPLKQVIVTLPPRETWSVPLVSLSFLLLLPCAVLALRVRHASGGKYLAAIIIVAIGAAATYPLSQLEMPNPFVPKPEVSTDEATTIFDSLLTNTYRSFEYRGEDDVYDALAISADGELLNDLYLQIRRGLEMQEQGGAISRIHGVAIVEGEKEPLELDETADERGFAYHCRWTVNGTVEHWGHVHSRTNEYQAAFVVEPRDEAWKITDVELLDEKRLKFETNLRGL